MIVHVRWPGKTTVRQLADCPEFSLLLSLFQEVTIYLLDHRGQYRPNRLKNQSNFFTLPFITTWAKGGEFWLVAIILMLPVYAAISFLNVISMGSRNKPWVVIVRTPQGLKPFVVKLFETDFIDTMDAVTNEVLGNVLASQFSLKTPKAALIDFDSSFMASIRRFDLLDILDSKDGRLKFGTELLDGQFSKLTAFTSSEARAAVDIDSLYAYDNLIRNHDRTHNPSNLLARSDEVFLIDHELAFDLNGNIDEELNTWQWNRNFWQYHVCYGYLKSSWESYKKEYFNVFEEDLRLLNVNVLAPYFSQLISEGFSPKRHSNISTYLLKMKQNSSKFVNILKAQIS